jgi:DNA repair ATPase RecN
MAKRASTKADRTEVANMITKALNDHAEDPEKLKAILLTIRETEERLTDAETRYDEARIACRDCKKDVEGIRKELRRVTKYGPDPQQGLPFVAEEEANVEGLDEGDAAAVLSYNKKKAKAVAATKKAAKKKTADLPY